MKYLFSFMLLFSSFSFAAAPQACFDKTGITTYIVMSPEEIVLISNNETYSVHVRYCINLGVGGIDYTSAAGNNSVCAGDKVLVLDNIEPPISCDILSVEK
jgi:hypothetical protein